LQEGDDLTIISWGTMLHKALEASVGFNCEIIDLLTLKPLDEDAILDSAKKTGRVVIVHEATKNMGLGAEVSAIIAEHAFGYLKAPVVRVGGPEAVTPMAWLEDEFMPSVARIRKAIELLIQY
jgi:pyruvate dehydrogenase E1 component beta subunit